MLSADVIEGLTELDWRIQLGLVLPAQLSETRTPAVEGCRPPRDPGAAWLFCASAQTTARLGEVAGLDRRRLGPEAVGGCQPRREPGTGMYGTLVDLAQTTARLGKATGLGRRRLGPVAVTG